MIINSKLSGVERNVLAVAYGKICEAGFRGMTERELTRAGVPLACYAIVQLVQLKMIRRLADNTLEGRYIKL